MPKLVLFLLLLTTFGSQAQSAQPSAQPQDTCSLWGNLAREEVQLWTSPLQLKKRNILSWAPVLAATGLAIKYDEEIFAFVESSEKKYPWIKSSGPILSEFGESYTVLGGALMFQLTGHLLKDEKALTTGALITQSLGHMAIISTVAKIGFGRKRPVVPEFGQDEWAGVSKGIRKLDFINGSSADYNSFPSGHTMAAFTLASVVALQYKETVWVPVLAWTVASGVGISRIVEDRHWAGDVILGAAVGYGIAKFVVTNNKNKRITFFPTFWKNQGALTGIYKF